MALTPKTVSPSRGLATPGRAARIIDTTAVAATSAFAGGALLSQTVIVPHWRAMDPVAFLPQFAVYGPVTGATVFPFEVTSVLLLSITTYSTVKSRRPGRLVWALATLCMVGTFLLLIYFVPSNLAMLDPTFPPQAVPAELTTWYRWNWVRAGLGLASAALACMALTASRGESATTPTVLQPFVRQGTILLHTRKRDGTWVPTPVNIAVDGERAYIRTYAKAGKSKRLRNFPDVRFCPSTLRGRPTGTTMYAHARLLHGDEARHAAHLLSRKHRVVHGVAVPLAHRLMRTATLHYELSNVREHPEEQS